MNALNPFVWNREIEDGIGRGHLAEEVALILKAGTNIQLFGPRGTGKTTFTVQLANELQKVHGPDAPPWECLRIDLRPVASLGDFVTAVDDAVNRHPSHQLRRRIRSELRGLEAELGVNLGVLKIGIKSTPSPEGLQAILTRQLRALRTLDEKLVIAFDEFQRLANCAGDPLAVIRSTLMTTDDGQQTSLLFTGSLRQKLELMLQDSTEAIWDQAHPVELPAITRESFGEYLELRFQATDKPIAARATDQLLELTSAHPKRTQQLAWMVWQQSPGDAEIEVERVVDAFETLVQDKDAPGRDFAVTYDYWLNGDTSEVNFARALVLVANGLSPGSPADTTRVGITHHQTATNALKALAQRGYVEKRAGAWQIVDPLFKEFLRRQPAT